MTVKTNFKLILPSIISAIIFTFALSFLVSQAMNNYLVQSFYDTLKNSIYENLKYKPNGSVELQNILTLQNFEIYCTTFAAGESASKQNNGDQGQQAIEACPENQLFIELPATSIFSSALPYSLSSISVWDNDNNLIQAIPISKAKALAVNKSKQQLSLNWSFNSDVLNIEGTNVYRGNFQYFLFQPEKENILFTLPVLNGDKTETLGYVAVYIKTPQTGIWDVISYLLPAALLLALVISLIGASLFSRNLRQQVADLQLVTAAWAIGDFGSKAQIRSQDEIGQLGSDLNKMAEQLEELIETKAKVASLETKQQLSRDLHDATKQQLFAASMQLNAVKTLFADQPEKAQQHLAHATDLTKMAQRELAAVIDQLGPVQLQESSFNEAVLNLINDFSIQQGIPIELTLASNLRASSDAKKELFRVLQESLSNIAKHSQATAASVVFSKSAGQLNMIVQDNGVGFNHQQPLAGLGIHSMRQRVKQLNGNFQMESQKKQGTTVTVQINQNPNEGKQHE